MFEIIPDKIPSTTVPVKDSLPPIKSPVPYAAGTIAGTALMLTVFVITVTEPSAKAVSGKRRVNKNIIKFFIIQ